MNLFLYVQKDTIFFSLPGRDIWLVMCVFLFEAFSYTRRKKSHQPYEWGLWTRFSRVVTSYLLQCCIPSSVRFALIQLQLNPVGRGLLIPSQKKVIWSPLFLKTNKKNFLVFFLWFPATRSCHHRLLCRCPWTWGPGRDVFQQLLSLPALPRSSEWRDGPGPVDAQREADPGRTWQPVQLSGSSCKARHTHPPCVCAHASLPMLDPSQFTIQGPFHVPPTQICQRKGNQSTHNRRAPVKYQWEAGN